jgi:hypothetical protein
MKKFSFHSETESYICYVILRKLFTVYIAALLLVPCSDTQVCVEASMAHHEDTQEEDICPPFCICQCCRTAVEEIDLFVWSTTEPKPVDTWSEFVIQSPKAPLHSIWQPPRLV